MFEEAQQFAPITTDDDGVLNVHLGADHPGFADPDYRARRDGLATLASNWRPGQPCPVADYTTVEHRVWQVVSEALVTKHRSYACREFLDGKESLQLPLDRIPQLSEVSDWLAPLTGFGYRPAPGLVPLRDFYGSLADKSFWSTQYIRHPSVPLYTPEPDVLHEVVGHGNTLANSRYTTLYELAGQASRRVRSSEALQFISKIFWFTLEFGIVWESGALKAYGAGILSSPGEIEAFRGMEVRPLDIVEMGSANYDITDYQGVLYAAESFAQIEDVVGAFWAECTDESIAQLTARHPAHT
ncbi:MAG: phenylalanine 4-monooxygenase [Nocardioidaceae bacterium]|nr:phenylalanine 4-monooxygenase [Nocardioidaceae bacterium]